MRSKTFLMFISICVAIALIGSSAFALPFPPTDPGPYPQGYVGAGGDYEVVPSGIVNFNGGTIFPEFSLSPPWLDYEYIRGWSIDYIGVGTESSYHPGPYNGSPVFELDLSYDHLVYDLELAPGLHTVRLWAEVRGYQELPPTNGIWMWGTSDTASLNIIPEPATLLLLGFGGLAVMRRRRVERN